MIPTTLLSLLVLALFARPTRALWPAPQQVRRGSGVLRLSNTFKITLVDPRLMDNVAELGDVSSSERQNAAGGD